MFQNPNKWCWSITINYSLWTTFCDNDDDDDEDVEDDTDSSEANLMCIDLRFTLNIGLTSSMVW